MPRIQIVVSVHGGVVQDVFCSADEAELIMVDWDADLCDSSDRNIARITEPGGDERLAFVSKCLAEPLWTMAGTDVEAAIRNAQAIRG
jgi:hypothetical protein